MAVTIIEPGTKEAPIYTRTCPECGCKFTYQWPDVVDCGWSGGYKMVQCPQCKYPVAHINNGAEINHPKLED